ncbi:MAG TPA: alpha-galactosidase [Solibacterales bacterium]|nr:alpha-galactosidase [Bryobacterales bacterium]
MRYLTALFAVWAVSAQTLPPEPAPTRPPDWLVRPIEAKARLYRGSHPEEIVLSNGLIRRAWRLTPNAATVAFDNLITGASLLRAVRPEAMVEIDGRMVAAGGLQGQPEQAYLRREWLDGMTAIPGALPFTGYEAGRTAERFAWRQVRYAGNTTWPPPGASLVLMFEAGGLAVRVHYEMYDGLPLLSKWIEVTNRTGRAFRLTRFVAESLAVVESESVVEDPGEWRHPDLHVDSDYAFLATHAGYRTNKVARWLPDPAYETQVNYLRKTPVLLECAPPIGPDALLEDGAAFVSFRVFELAHDSTDRERQGLALRRMYRTLSPWATENPILMHVRQSEPEAVRLAIDQAADVGFEMVIMSFGSGFNMENEDPAYLARIRELAGYARSKKIELGGYSLLASRKIGEQEDAINPKTGKPGGAIFENSPCLGSKWGQSYFRKLTRFAEQTGIRVLEHDGSYPGDVCASKLHPGHRGLEDSQWTQWRAISGFYQWARGQGIYLNVPDWYFLAGSNKSAMGYRETNWSLPRERQILLARQNVFDGTWEKTPSMGWMFVPLVQYHGGGAEAKLEPLKDHLEAYEQHLAQNFGAGVQACYRGPRLYDSPETRAVVKRWVDFYKAHRAILDSDIIHVRRPDGRDIDVILHVNPALAERGLAMIHNPLNQAVTRSVRLPLYYTGLETQAQVREKGGAPRTFRLSRGYEIEVPVTIPARSFTWLTVEAAARGARR